MSIGMSLLAAGVLLEGGLIGLRVSEALTGAEDSKAFQLLQSPAAARILMVGDDAGVGSGVALSSASVAGRIAQRYPCVSIVNRARDGATVRDVAAQIDGTGDTHFDLLLVLAGANDVLRFVSDEETARAARAMLAIAGARARHVVFLNSSRLESRLLPPPLGPWYQRRALEKARVLSQVSRAAGVEYVDAPMDGSALTAANVWWPARLHADDDTYARWFRLLMGKSRVAPLLQC
ncbi:MAG: SGNH/GDSL hydrolase family protein [Gammaproteobacteria bacterium]